MHCSIRLSEQPSWERCSDHSKHELAEKHGVNDHIFEEGEEDQSGYGASRSPSKETRRTGNLMLDVDLCPQRATLGKSQVAHRGFESFWELRSDNRKDELPEKSRVDDHVREEREEDDSRKYRDSLFPHGGSLQESKREPAD